MVLKAGGRAAMTYARHHMPTLPNACFSRTHTHIARRLRSLAHLPSAASAFPRRAASMSATAAALRGHATPVTPANPTTTMPPQTRILPVDAAKLGAVTLSRPSPDALLEDWDVTWADTGADIARLRQAAAELQEGTLPVAFPTETVYGLGADATSSTAVRGIYAAKQRPADNPLIVHIASLAQLRSLLRSPADTATRDADLIPPVYHPLIRRFWPGPLTIILPLPTPSPLAPEVTAGLSTFGARMPGSLIALLLIRLADRPVAAPSANASTKPSPTAAEHVAHDLAGRIRTILDGGPCDVGVESTVVDGVSGDRPVILRPGGVSIDELRECEGWEDVGVAYRDKAEMDADGNRDGEKAGRKREAPRAPGMKYRHYSPRAPVVLFEAGTGVPGRDAVKGKRKVGAIRTKKWPRGCGLPASFPDARNGKEAGEERAAVPAANGVQHQNSQGFSKMLDTLTVRPTPKPQRLVSEDAGQEIWEVELGVETKDIARGLFSALRELDRKDVDIIFVEGIDEKEGDVAAAVMNRLRKAAEVEVKGS